MLELLPYFNTLFALGAFGWVVRVERRLVQIEVTCRLKERCEDGGKGELHRPGRPEVQG